MKTVLITGTSRGIGYELVKLFANHNYHVLAISRNTSTVNALHLENVKTLSVDFEKNEEIVKIKDFVQHHWKQIDIIIHNAGKLINKPFNELTTHDFISVYQVNIFAVAEITKQLLPFLKPKSHVITISSIGGVQGSLKFPGLAAYSSSKGALITLTELLAEEFKSKEIYFNCLALGAVQTEMLSQAFPDYQAPVSANEMASYIFDFARKGHQFFNGKILEVSSTTP